MAAYFARRFLLLIPTFLGITILVFMVTRFVPGGPVDQMLMQMQGAGAGVEGGGGEGENLDVPPEAIENLERHYHFDWPIWKQYLQFLGPLNLDERGPLGEDASHYELVDWIVDEGDAVAEGDPVVRIRAVGPVPGEGLSPTTVSEEIFAPADGTVTNFRFAGGGAFDEGAVLYDLDGEPVEGEDLWSKTFSGVLAADLGESYKHKSSVAELVVERFPISLRFGLTGFLLAYLICIPLGVLKAVRHGSTFDFASSALVFIGYSIPGWALGAVLLVLFGGGSFWDVFPLGEIESAGIDGMSTVAKIKDWTWHMVLPVTAYCAGSFATLTVLTKNSLMDNLGQDYVRTAFAKGLSERRVILLHTLRNSLIPLCTGLGHAIGIIMAGSYLIETVFNIDGLGLLGFKSIVGRDYTVVMGVLVINTVLVLVGNILSDVLYVLVDPRIRFS